MHLFLPTAHGLQAASVIVDAGATDLAAPVEGPLGGTTELAFRNKHMEYALTWYGLAAALVSCVPGVFAFCQRPPDQVRALVVGLDILGGRVRCMCRPGRRPGI